MRKLVLILIAFIAALTFFRDFDTTGGLRSTEIHATEMQADGINAVLE
ncbi:MAG: hypothetical protein FWH19_05205 [Treponema sp.]|nr:hypothetical protein [Treponema sp.]